MRAPTPEELADDLVRRLAEDPPPDPFVPVRVAVPSRGMERWLAQRLSHGLGAAGGEAGVCANVEFPFPGSVVQEALSAVLGDEPGHDPWAPARLAWPVLGALASLPEDDLHAPLRAHLAPGARADARRRLPLARRIADLFDRYALYRPDLVARWEAGDDVDTEGRSLPANAAWQPPLWRALVERLAVPSPDVRLRDALDALARDVIAHPDRLPAPLLVFGVHALPPPHLELLEALGEHVEVVLHVLTPCSAWDPARPAPEALNPLLASCGAAARDAHTALARHPSRSVGRAAAARQLVLDTSAGSTASLGPAARVGSALEVLQDDLRHDRRRGRRGADPVALAPHDRSVQLHACHGPLRQLEVLREVLLGLLDDDPTLEPRDVVVLTPDIGVYDPLVRAVFSEGDRPDAPPAPDGGSGTPVLPFRIADRAVRDDNPVASALFTIGELVSARVRASAVVDLLATPPVRARFGLSGSDVGQLAGWVPATGISWGIDAEHRRELIGLDDAAHTWEAGLRRLVLGAAMPDDGTRSFGGVLPYDDLEGADVDALGRLSGALEALFAALRALRGARTVDAWRDAFDGVVDALLDPGPGPVRDAELTAQLAVVREALNAVVDDSRDADGNASGVELTLEEFLAVLGMQLGRRGGRAHYGSGAVTVAGLVPLRNVPHRVVCLVGLDDGALPRTGDRHGFDLVASRPRPGDPDPRVEDRALLLDAVLAARDHLVVTYTGHDPRTNESRQPAVPVSELLDVLDATLSVDAGGEGRARRAREQLVVDHPLQPHSPRYFREPAGDEAPVPRSFDRRQLAAARAVAGERAPTAPFFPADRPLPPPTEELAPEVIELDQLTRFLRHPVRFLLQRRVGIVLGDDDRRLEDRDPTGLGPLERWQLGQELLEQRLAGTVPEHWRELTLARGTVPAGALGEAALEGIAELVDRLRRAVEDRDGPRTQLTVDLDLRIPEPADGGSEHRRLTGLVELRGDTLLDVSVSRPDGRHRLSLWPRLLAAVVSAPEQVRAARVLGRGDNRAGYRESVLVPPEGADHDGPDVGSLSRRRLAELVGCYLRGHVEPVPLLPRTSEVFARRVLVHGDGRARALERAGSTWEGNDRMPGEQSDPYVVQAFGAGCTLAELDHRTSFADDAVRIMGPVLDAEARAGGDG